MMSGQDVIIDDLYIPIPDQFMLNSIISSAKFHIESTQRDMLSGREGNVIFSFPAFLNLGTTTWAAWLGEQCACRTAKAQTEGN